MKTIVAYGSWKPLWLTSLFGMAILVIIFFEPPVYATVDDAEATAPNLIVDVNAIQHAISPYIYGVNFGDADQIVQWDAPVNRWGGNAVSRYNWQTDVFNPGNYYYFENVNNYDPGTLPYGSSADRFITANRNLGTDSLMQIPLIGWTPKDRTEDCGFHWDLYGAQTETDWVDNWGCGNGISAETGEYITWNDPHDTSYPTDENFQRGWINHLTGQFGNAANDGVRFYALDNEPMIWHFNHRDVHPQWSSFDSVTEKGIRYGSMIKQADPTAQVMGPGAWGWQPYYYSALDIETWFINGTFPDREAHGWMPFLGWYLQEMRRFEEQNGYRILDYIDIHAYPQGVGDDGLPFALGEAGSHTVQDMRLRSTQELWNPDYYPESWIPEPIYAIRLMHEWIDQHYPGTKVAITEYRWGGEEHINGALAQADVLGIFGREDVGLATVWDAPEIGQPGDFAFRMYRNYDGQGRQFGNLSVSASSNDETQLSVYAARRTSDNMLTLMVVNKTRQNRTSMVTLDGGVSGAGQVYRYSSADLNNIQYIGQQNVGGNAFTTTFPRESITLFTFPLEPIGDYYFLPIVEY